MQLQIFRRRAEKRDWVKFFSRCLENSFKCGILLTLPLFAVIPCCTFWYFALYHRHVHFHDELKDIAVASWIPTFGILYCLLAAIVLGSVFTEYKNMRNAIKCYDIAAFMNLRDEDISPVLHALMSVLAIALLGAFMGLKYPDVPSGLWVIGTTTYILSLIYWIIIEIDNPLTGVFFIKNVHPEWLAIDCRQWRDEHYKKMRSTTTVTTVKTEVEEVSRQQSNTQEAA